MTVYVVALLMQIMGVYYVIHDAVKSRANVNVFSETWEQLDWPHNPNDWPHFKEPAIAQWIKSEYSLSDLRRFAPIVVLLLGVILGFLGNALALYIPAS